MYDTALMLDDLSSQQQLLFQRTCFSMISTIFCQKARAHRGRQSWPSLYHWSTIDCDPSSHAWPNELARESKNVFTGIGLVKKVVVLRLGVSLLNHVFVVVVMISMDCTGSCSLMNFMTGRSTAGKWARWAWGITSCCCIWKWTCSGISDKTYFFLTPIHSQALNGRSASRSSWLWRPSINNASTSRTDENVLTRGREKKK